MAMKQLESSKSISKSDDSNFKKRIQNAKTAEEAKKIEQEIKKLNLQNMRKEAIDELPDDVGNYKKQAFVDSINDVNTKSAMDTIVENAKVFYNSEKRIQNQRKLKGVAKTQARLLAIKKQKEKEREELENKTTNYVYEFIEEAKAQLSNIRNDPTVYETFLRNKISMLMNKETFKDAVFKTNNKSFFEINGTDYD